MLALGAQKAEDVLLTLEGTVANGLAKGRITGGTANDEFRLAKENERR